MGKEIRVGIPPPGRKIKKSKKEAEEPKKEVEEPKEEEEEHIQNLLLIGDAYLIFVISFTQAFCAVEICYTQNVLFVTKLNSR